MAFSLGGLGGGGQQQGQGQGLGGGQSNPFGGGDTTIGSEGGNEISVKFYVLVTGGGENVWGSGWIYDTQAAAEAALEAQRGSFPAGVTYTYTISTRNSSGVESTVKTGTTTSTQYVANNNLFQCWMRDAETNKDIMLTDPIYDTQAEAWGVIAAKLGDLAAKSEKGTVNWAIYQNGVVVQDGLEYWPKERGEWKVEDAGETEGGKRPRGGGPNIALPFIAVLAIIVIAVWLWKPQSIGDGLNGLKKELVG